MTTFTPEEDVAILRGGWDDRTLADMLFMPVEMMRARRVEVSPPLPTTKDRAFWSPEELTVLSTLRSQGVRLGEIARRLGRSKSAVKHQWKRKKPSKICRPQIPWTLEHYGYVRSNRAAGIPLARIAQQLGRSYQSVRGASRRMGLGA